MNHDDEIHERPPGIKLFKSDVWGKFDSETLEEITKGMIVARGRSNYAPKDHQYTLPNICPVWNEVLPYKSVTAICTEEEFGDVVFWLSYVHGGEYEMVKRLPDNKVAIRSNYQAW